MTEPFGYFRAEPFGWTDCADDADGAVPLYDQAAIDALNEAIDAKSIDDRFGGRLAMMLEFMILNPTRHYNDACALIVTAANATYLALALKFKARAERKRYFWEASNT